MPPLTEPRTEARRLSALRIARFVSTLVAMQARATLGAVEARPYPSRFLRILQRASGLIGFSSHRGKKTRHRDPPPKRDVVDQASWESFPASDPPAY